MVETYLERLLTVFVEKADDKDFVILSDADDVEQFVQFMRRRGTIYAEVSSRQWGPGGTERPLPDSNELSLIRLGFTHGGKAKNYALDGLTADGQFLAGIARQAFEAAYGTPLAEVPVVASTSRNVELVAKFSGSPTAPINPSAHGPREWPCPICNRRDPFVGLPVRTGPGLLNRARRAAGGNFIRIQLDCEEHVLFVDAISRIRTFDELPEQVQDWILKAEDGPLFA